MNKKNMAGIILIIIIGVAIGASGQIFLKKGLQQIGDVEMRGIKSILPAIFKIITNKFVFWGLALSVFAAFFWILTLLKINLNVAYPLAGGLFYISVIALSVIFLGEKVTVAQLIGTGIILLGTIILTNYGK